jgi:peptide/nickel transport system substrate-binding protein
MAMRRRDFLAASAGLVTVAASGRARAQRRDPKVLRFVPQANLTSLDPIWTTAQVTTNHGYAVFDTLYGLDSALRPQPQMAKGHSVSADGRIWTVELREGLKWHDGQPVLARDCVASLQRWAKRDAFGQLLDAMADMWEALDDKRFRVTFRSAFPLFIEAIAKPLGVTPFMMPERVAKTDAFKQITEIIGSGPYRFLQDEYVSGSKAVYARFGGYVPRSEAPERTAGGKVAHFERIEWIVMPDAATAAAALQAGEIDWWDQALPDLIPVLQASKNVKVAIHDRAGFIGMMRFNTLHPPFDNPAIRRAIMFAVEQADYMRAVTGDIDDNFRSCFSMWPCGTTYASEAGAEPLKGPRDLKRARMMLREAGYKGERVVIISPTDIASIGPLGQITDDLFRKLGMNVELMETDWGSVVQRRASREPIANGGWSVFHTWWPSLAVDNPAINQTLRGQGGKGWFGWYENPTAEELATKWLMAKDSAEQKAIAEAIQVDAFKQAPIVPLGQFFIPTAYRADLTGFVESTIPIMWNVRRAQ